MVAAAVVALGVCAAARVQPRDTPLVQVERSTDVAWLERIGASPAFAREIGSARETPSKSLRVAAFARLGAIGTAESLAAIGRIERDMNAVPLTPATVPLDVWPTVGRHMSDMNMNAAGSPLAAAAAQNGVTYAVVEAELLGGMDLFLISTRTPADRASWSRPKLVAPVARNVDFGKATLAVRGPRTLVFTAPQQTVQIALDDVERDSDGDGWTDREEARIGANPHTVDSDDDGIVDGRDVCPLYPRPSGADEASQILQAAVFGAFAMTGSRQLLYVTPQTPRVHLSGYGGPVVFDRATPRNGDGGGAVYVSWKIASRTDNDAIVEITDWEGMLAAGGQDVMLKRTAGRWVVVAVRSAWVS